MKKIILYFSGIILCAFGIALNYKTMLGSAPVDAFSMNLSELIGLDVSLIILLMNTLMVLLYYVKKRNKDIYFSIISVFVLSGAIAIFRLILAFEVNDYLSKSLLAFLAINLISIGVSFILISKVSMTPFESFVSIIKERIIPLPFGIVRMIVEMLLIILGASISYIAFNDLGQIGIVTIIMMIFVGPLCDLYVFLFKKRGKGETNDKKDISLPD